MTYIPQTAQQVASILLLDMIERLDELATRMALQGNTQEAENHQHAIDELFDAYQWLTNKPALPSDEAPKREAHAFLEEQKRKFWESKA